MTDPVPSKERCNCPNGSYGIKHTSLCYEEQLVTARRTAEYWKAEHLAGNAVIERLRKVETAWLEIFGERDAENAAKWVAELLWYQRPVQSQTRLSVAAAQAEQLGQPFSAHLMRAAHEPKPPHEREPPHCSKVGAVLVGGGYLDRMKDLTEDDTAEVVVQAFLKAVRPVLADRSAPEPPAAPMKLLFDNDWLRSKIESDPDDEPTAGGPAPSRKELIDEIGRLSNEVAELKGHVRLFEQRAAQPPRDGQ